MASIFSPVSNAAFAVFSLWRTVVLRILLLHNGWITNGTSTFNQLYCALVRFLTHTFEGTKAFQLSLPRLPVGNLDHTKKALLKSVRPLLTDDEYAQTVEDFETFCAGPGPGLQRKLQLMRFDPRSDNWLAPIWESIAYNRVRDPLPLASHFYGCDIMPFHVAPPTSNQAERAATITMMTLKCREMIRDNTFPVLYAADCIPMCMSAYDRMFGTVRVPRVGEDEIVHYANSTHIVVTCAGRVFSMDVYRRDGTILSRGQLKAKMESILERTKNESQAPPSPPHGVREFGLLSTLPRDDWAAKREQFAAASEVNAQALQRIESALFVINLDGTVPADMNAYANACQHNQGLNRLFDKSFQMCVFENGLAGLNVEHTWADGTVVGHVWEKMLQMEACAYEGHWQRLALAAARRGAPPPKACFAALVKDDVRHAKEEIAMPTLLEFDNMDGTLNQWIEEARQGMQAQLAHVSNRLTVVKGIGKEHVKKCRISPDAFAQFALQLANKRVTGHHSLTYQSVSMRLYRLGRTETNRSLSPESVAFIDALDRAPADMSPEDKKNLAKLCMTAAAAHQARIKAAMVGNGVDRHLIGLRVLAKFTNTDTGAIFDGPAFKQEWRLSTTTGPMFYDPKMSYVLGPLDQSISLMGGGFTTCVADGVGASYFMFDDAILLHANARTSPNAATPASVIAERFEQEFFRATQEIYAVFQ